MECSWQINSESRTVNTGLEFKIFTFFENDEFENANENAVQEQKTVFAECENYCSELKNCCRFDWKNFQVKKVETETSLTLKLPNYSENYTYLDYEQILQPLHQTIKTFGLKIYNQNEVGKSFYQENNENVIFVYPKHHFQPKPPKNLKIFSNFLEHEKFLIEVEMAPNLVRDVSLLFQVAYREFLDMGEAGKNPKNSENWQFLPPSDSPKIYLSNLKKSQKYEIKARTKPFLSKLDLSNQWSDFSEIFYLKTQKSKTASSVQNLQKYVTKIANLENAYNVEMSWNDLDSEDVESGAYLQIILEPCDLQNRNQIYRDEIFNLQQIKFYNFQINLGQCFIYKIQLKLDQKNLAVENQMMINFQIPQNLYPVEVKSLDFEKIEFLSDARSDANANFEVTLCDKSSNKCATQTAISKIHKFPTGTFQFCIKYEIHVSTIYKNFPTWDTSASSMVSKMTRGEVSTRKIKHFSLATFGLSQVYPSAFIETNFYEINENLIGVSVQISENICVDNPDFYVYLVLSKDNWFHQVSCLKTQEITIPKQNLPQQKFTSQVYFCCDKKLQHKQILKTCQSFPNQSSKIYHFPSKSNLIGIQNADFYYDRTKFQHKVSWEKNYQPQSIHHYKIQVSEILANSHFQILENIRTNSTQFYLQNKVTCDANVTAFEVSIQSVFEKKNSEEKFELGPKKRILRTCHSLHAVNLTKLGMGILSIFLAISTVLTFLVYKNKRKIQHQVKQRVWPEVPKPILQTNSISGSCSSTDGLLTSSGGSIFSDLSVIEYRQLLSNSEKYAESMDDNLDLERLKLISKISKKEQDQILRQKFDQQHQVVIQKQVSSDHTSYHQNLNFTSDEYRKTSGIESVSFSDASCLVNNSDEAKKTSLTHLLGKMQQGRNISPLASGSSFSNYLSYWKSGKSWF